ncbi:hypothetical protein C8J56DRAFT_474497 [Mycena floridula]|nr:hypothetical protein C8J56DRAFT_474497 [Mycena floridula]
MLSTAPVELVAAILDFLGDDLETLKSLLLVCRLWRTICRPYLFTSLSLLYSSKSAIENCVHLRTFLDFLAHSPEIAMYVKQVSLVKPSPEQNDLVREVLGHLINVRSILFIRWSFSADISIEVRSIIFTFLGSLDHAVSIKFATCKIVDRGIVMEMLGRCKYGVEELILMCQCSEGAGAQTSVPNRTRIQAKKVSVCVTSLILATFGPGGLLLQASQSLECSAPLASVLLPQIGRSLQSMEITVASFSPRFKEFSIPLDLGLTPELRSLKFSIHNTSRCAIAYASIYSSLSSHPSYPIQKITIRRTGRDEPDTSPLLALDEILGSLIRFPALKRVSLRIPRSVKDNETRFPMLRARGILKEKLYTPQSRHI